MAAYAIKNTIIKTAFPRGVFLEGTISGTPKPGNSVEVKAATEFTNGRPTLQLAAPGTDGKAIMNAILLEDAEQGKTVDDAFVSGTRGRAYVPAPGEEMLVRCGETAGTGNSFTIGERLMTNATGGYYILASGTIEDTPFVCLETNPLVAANSLVFVQKT